MWFEIISNLFHPYLIPSFKRFCQNPSKKNGETRIYLCIIWTYKYINSWIKFIKILNNADVIPAMISIELELTESKPNGQTDLKKLYHKHLRFFLQEDSHTVS